MNPPADWYPDPTGRHDQRYWDGEQWTEHVFSDGAQGVDPLDASAPATGSEEEDATDAARVASEMQGTGLFDDAGTAAEADGDAWAPEDAVVEDPTTADVAPEVEPEDVVATMDEMSEDATDASDTTHDGPTQDFSDAFMVTPETASRLVGRGAARSGAPEEPVEPEEPLDQPPAEGPGSTAAEMTPPVEEQPSADEAPPDEAPTDEAPTSGVIDAPPPAMPTPTEGPDPSTGLGISGDLVGGAFGEREAAGPVALQNARLLRCRVTPGSGVVARQGTMVAYQGEVSFERQGAGGVTRALKRAATGEGLAMMRVEGNGDVFFADGAQHAFLLELDGGPGLSVNGRNVLAFSASLAWDIERVKGATLLAGGLFNTTLRGNGWVALVSDGEPVVLRTDDAPTFVDVNALVAWSGGLSTRIVNTVSAKSLVGLGSGEAFQMAFAGSGIVIVQPSEGPMGGAAAT